MVQPMHLRKFDINTPADRDTIIRYTNIQHMIRKHLTIGLETYLIGQKVSVSDGYSNLSSLITEARKSVKARPICAQLFQ